MLIATGHGGLDASRYEARIDGVTAEVPEAFVRAELPAEWPRCGWFE